MIDWDGETLKAEGMDRVEGNADQYWKLAAADALRRTAIELRFLTTDDVLKRIDPRAGTHNLKALGPVMRNGALDGWIVKSHAEPVKTARTNNHRRPLQVWDSLIFRKAA